MKLRDFDYELPPELIAQSPASERDASRLMTLGRGTGEVGHHVFRDLVDYLEPGDTLVLNDTRVFPARLVGIKAATGGKVEALLIKDLGGGRYTALVKGGPKVGVRLSFNGGKGDVGGLQASVESITDGRYTLKFIGEPDMERRLDELGSMPLPPYISAPGRDSARDSERYQTVYANKRGAVAAPTAGLHFTDGLLGALRRKGVVTATVTLHVGPGTFMPVRVDDVREHVMEVEEYEVTPEAADAVNQARDSGRRVVAVGTTSLRTLESAAVKDGRLIPGKGSSGLFIYPGYEFRLVDGLITNFHLPESTLIMLVCAFAGRERTLNAYKTAVAGKYRFYSYGDAMLIL